jgi:hypothetical protein
MAGTIGVLRLLGVCCARRQRGDSPDSADHLRDDTHKVRSRGLRALIGVAPWTAAWSDDRWFPPRVVAPGPVGGVSTLAGVLPDSLPVPWVTNSERVLWSSADSRTQVTFDGGGIKAFQNGARVADQPWSRVTDLDIRVPYSSRHMVTALRVWDMVSPKPASFSAAQGRISLAAGFDVLRWAFVPRMTFDWRIQFILDDLLRLLAPDFSPLGSPGPAGRCGGRSGTPDWPSRATPDVHRPPGFGSVSGWTHGVRPGLARCCRPPLARVTCIGRY